MRSRSGAELRTVICKDCGLVWSDPFPHDPRQFYEEDYRLEYKNTYAPKAKHILRAGRVAVTRHEKIKHLLDKPQTMLDVGTGGGEFAYLIKSLGHDLHGIEPNKGYGQYSAAQYDLNLQFGFIQDAQFAENSFDLITIWHVLEHTEDPFFVLGKLRSLLKADGVLVVEVPNIEATCQSPSSTFHEAHLYNFNLATLRRMGEKAGLVEDRHVFSEDGGNVTLFFKKAEPVADQAASWGIPENAERITAIVRGHTNLRHYMRAAPYLRFIKRMTRSLFENRHVKGFENNKSLLDQLYRGL
ncbi:methyltransferase type 11 [Methylomonas methanica]|uniref:Methyltransferase type 11 n=2 Tax=Methylomonas methanica TaxID=421 RepID=A0A177LTZ3_METMH|nr:methyltransferase type 11 [Methylomonas methanica]